MLSLTIALAFSVAVPVQSHPDEEEPQHASHGDSPPLGALGSYPATRDASGTSWQPDSTPMEGFHFSGGGFDFMVHGFLNVGSIQALKPRGASEAFTTNMLMLMGSRPAGRGRLGFRVMGSLEPVMGASGYPLLLQTGESADGVTPLLDRQHPHDVMMEIAVTYSREVSRDGSFFLYVAPVGEPAVGPTAFMHRYSSEANAFAPVAHHWMDATHIAYGVVTAGWVAKSRVKLEASAFNGREPDHRRWNVEELRLDSFATRFTVNPTPSWSVQASMAKLTEPERLHPGVDFLRMTASATHNRRLGDGNGNGNWQTTFAWGRNKREWGTGAAPPPSPPLAPTEPLPGTTPVHFHGGLPGNGVTGASTQVQNAVLAETGLRFLDTHSIHARFEYAEKDELFDVSNPLHSAIFDVKKLDVGYGFDFLRTSHFTVGAGFNTTVYWLPDGLAESYGFRPRSYAFFMRTRIR